MTSWKRKSLNELKILRKSKPSEKQSARQGKKKLM
jgi:hypothetical protein